MKISILCVGKVKEKFYRDAIQEYTKRLSRYANVNVVEVDDEKTPDNASETETENILRKEGVFAHLSMIHSPPWQLPKPSEV